MPPRSQPVPSAAEPPPGPPPAGDATPDNRGLVPALLVILGGVAAALHVGKLPPAIGALQDTLGLTLVQAGFLLSLVQAAGMSLGLFFGAWADVLGLKRSLVAGLLLLSAAGAGGGLASWLAPPQAVPLLLVLRALEGLGFLMVVLPAPALVRRLVAPGRVATMLGVWGAYMPLATALALLAGPLAVTTFGWPRWWWALALVSAAMALVVARGVPNPDRPAAPAGGGWRARLGRTLAAPGPWLVATSFAMYSGQWLAVIGFLPVICLQAGLAPAATGVLTAGAAAVNVLGNLAAGRLLQRGWPAPRLLRIGFVAMALASLAAFAGTEGSGLPPALRYAAVLAFSAAGGLIPATLFALAVRLAPGEDTLASTVGWVQQWSALGQFAGPPLVAWVASRAGGWQHTWLATGGCALVGLVLAARIAARLRHAG
jgi:CP family cyanate transporter-like MFS transporter